MWSKNSYFRNSHFFHHLKISLTKFNADNNASEYHNYQFFSIFYTLLETVTVEMN